MALASQSQNSVKRYFTKALKPNLASHTQPIQLENINHLEVPSSNEFDLDSLKFDPRERTQILDFHPNHRDVIRREYLRQCPCQPRLHNFPKTNFSGSMRRFNPKWFDDEYHDWLEYSVSKDASYCLFCYLFKDNNIHQGGGDVFPSIGFKSWHKKKSFDKHGSSSIHNESKKKCQDLRQQRSIQSSFERQSNQLKHEYWIRLTASVNVVRLLITQGLAFRGHDESKSSLSRGNFLQTLSWYAKVCDNIRDYVLEHAPQNDQMISPIIQKDIVTACKIETTKAIIEELNGDYFALLVDESFDTSRKEKMEISAIVNLLDQHSLSLSYVRGQYYDGASNMQGSLFKRMDEFRESQKERIQEALDMAELTTGRGLNQEFGLSRACDTRWGSHFKSFNNFILIFGSILDVLELLVLDAHSTDERSKAMGYLRACQTFEFDGLYVSSLRSRRKPDDCTVLHHYRVDVFCKIIDWQIQELNERFDEVTTHLLHGIACLNPINSFSSFDIRKIMRMAELYPDDFDEFSMGALENQLASYIIDVRDVDERFSDLHGLCDLSKRLVQTKKHSNYPLVFRLVKLALLLPVATASVKRAFSAMKFIKNDLRSRMNDEFFSGCLVPYVEKNVFDSISNDAIIKTFQDMKPRRVQL
ncbi:uncharacterized protein [Nicotiana sylvestris]|uniref:uncharacterized protein n=1 Tax=Nicotiana sylvestris TaxID=4096 RepID=UPI00388C7F34